MASLSAELTAASGRLENAKATSESTVQKAQDARDASYVQNQRAIEKARDDLNRHFVAVRNLLRPELEQLRVETQNEDTLHDLKSRASALVAGAEEERARLQAAIDNARSLPELHDALMDMEQSRMSLEEMDADVAALDAGMGFTRDDLLNDIELAMTTGDAELYDWAQGMLDDIDAAIADKMAAIRAGVAPVQAENSVDNRGQNNYNLSGGDSNGNNVQAAFGATVSGNAREGSQTGGDGTVSESVGPNGDKNVAQTVSGLERRADNRDLGELVKTELKKRGKDPVDLRTESNPSSFYAAIGEAKQGNDHGAFVTQHEVDEYAGMQLFLDDTKGVGVAVTADGDIVSVFKNPNRSRARGSVSSILLTALDNGGVKLDNYNGGLSFFYNDHGFIPVARTAFVDEYAPDDWNYARDGRPDIIFWMHNGESVDQIAATLGTRELPDLTALPLMEYDEAAAYRDSLIAQQKPADGVSVQGGEIPDLGANTATDVSDGSKQSAIAIGERLGIPVVFEQMPEGKHGFYENGIIHINTRLPEGETPAMVVLRHELTHFIESGNGYTEFSNFVFRIAQQLDKETNINSVLKGYITEYGARGIELTPDGARREFVANFVQNNLLKDPASIDALVREQSGFAGRVLNWIQYRIAKLKLRGQNSAEARAMLDAERMYVKAFAKAGKNPVRVGAQYMVGGVNGSSRYDYSKSFAEQVDDWLAGEIPTNDTLILGGTPQIYQDIGFTALPITIDQRHLRSILRTPKNPDHDLGVDIVKRLPELIADPVLIIEDETALDGNVFIVFGERNPKTDRQIIGAMRMSSGSSVNGISIDANRLKTSHSRGDLTERIARAVKKENSGESAAVYYVDKQRATDLLEPAQSQVLATLVRPDGFVNSIDSPLSPVNRKK